MDCARPSVNMGRREVLYYTMGERTAPLISPMTSPPNKRYILQVPSTDPTLLVIPPNDLIIHCQENLDSYSSLIQPIQPPTSSSLLFLMAELLLQLPKEPTRPLGFLVARSTSFGSGLR